MLFAAAQTLAGGRSSGFIAAAGIHLGGYVHVIAAAAGLSILFHAVPLLYGAVKLVGAGYLMWLGLSLFRATGGGQALPHGIARKSGRQTFLQSITVELLNPKTALFFVAFLPQFTAASSGAPVWVQLLILGTIVNLMFSAADVVGVLLANAIVSRLGRSDHAQRVIRGLGGSLLIGLGAHLALQRG